MLLADIHNEFCAFSLPTRQNGANGPHLPDSPSHSRGSSSSIVSTSYSTSDSIAVIPNRPCRSYISSMILNVARFMFTSPWLDDAALSSLFHRSKIHDHPATLFCAGTAVAIAV